MEPLKTGDLVMLNSQNIWAKHRCKNLEDEILRHFKVILVSSNLWYCKLKQPENWKIDSVINGDIIELYSGTDSVKQILEIEGNGADWPKVWIIPSRPLDDNPR